MVSNPIAARISIRGVTVLEILVIFMQPPHQPRQHLPISLDCLGMVASLLAYPADSLAHSSPAFLVIEVHLCDTSHNGRASHLHPPVAARIVEIIPNINMAIPIPRAKSSGSIIPTPSLWLG